MFDEDIGDQPCSCRDFEEDEKVEYGYASSAEEVSELSCGEVISEEDHNRDHQDQ